MFQRHGKVRQAGFIRRHDLSKRKSTQIRREETQFGDQNSLEFSPFKDQSPQPIQRILQTHRQKTSSNFEQFCYDYAEYTQQIESRQRRQIKKREKKNKQHSHKKHRNILPSVPSIKQLKMMKDFKEFNQPRLPLSMKQIQKLEFIPERFQRYETTEQARNTIGFATESIEQIQQISHKPEPVHLSLAESFNLNCRKMKQRLERERIKFNKMRNSRNKQQRSRSYDNLNQKSSFSTTQKTKGINESRELNQNHLPTKLLHRNSDGETKRRPQRDFSNDNKQNCQENANLRQKQLQTPRPTNDQKPTKFFIPAPTSRSKPITPQQAYQHSLKKWKQLPEVVARQKQKEKQAQMRQRISKMKAHDIQVRRSLKR